MRICWMAVATVTVALNLPLVPAAGAGGDKKLPMNVQLAKDIVTNHLSGIDGLDKATVAWLDDAALKESFPSLTFFAVHYRKFPVAVAPPKGLSSANLLVVDKNNKLTVVSSPNEFTEYFGKAFAATKAKVDEKSAAILARAWLTLSQEMVQDGFYAFEIMKPEVKKNDKNGWTAEGKAMVSKGGNGEIQVTLEFSGDGSMTASQEYKLQQGARPKCQATKLLDPDPIVRYMAESELTFMGKAALPYLREQRARAADPMLAQAIDRMMHRIEAAGW